jgi:hypothetical protein
MTDLCRSAARRPAWKRCWGAVPACARAGPARELHGSPRGCPLMPLGGCCIGYVAGTGDLLIRSPDSAPCLSVSVICRSRLVALHV